MLKVIRDMCPFYEDYSETVVRSAWLKQDWVPKLAGRLDNELAPMLPIEDSQDRKIWQDAVMRPINSWRYSQSDAREDTQTIGTIMFDLSTKSVVGVELYEARRGSDYND